MVSLSAVGKDYLPTMTDCAEREKQTISSHLGVVLVGSKEDVRGRVHADGVQHLQLAQALQPVQPESVSSLQ